jgi:hypothetical protein
MRLIWLGCLALLILSRPAFAADLVVRAADDYLIDATINGQPVRLRVDPETSGYVVLNQDTATRLGLRPSLIRSQTRIGPVRLTGWSRVAELSIGEWTGRRRTVWLDREAAAGADGLIGPADMHYDRVTFEIAPPRPGERTVELPLEFERGFGLFHPLRIGDQVVRFQFSTSKPATLATAGAGAHLAASLDGAWTGEARDALIEFGVVRPVRPLHFGRPLEIAALGIDGLLVRTGDNRGDLSLPPEPDADPDEVVVTAGSRQRAIFTVHVGLDRLLACSQLTWDNGTRRMTFSCGGER